MSAQLLSDIESFLQSTGMSAFRFGLLAARNGRLVERLRKPRANGKPARVWPETEIEIRAFMRQERSRRPAKPTSSEERAA